MKTPDEFIQLFESETRVTDHIVLANDLDFSEKKITTPLGMHDETCFAFGGILDGKGHTITMLNVTSQGAAGLFCSLEEATIKNLVIDSSCLFSGDSVGALCPFAKGSVTLNNITNMANVGGSSNIGGLIGYIDEIQGPTIVQIENCFSNCSVTSMNEDTGVVGGLIGGVYDNTHITLNISNCSNNITIAYSPNDAGAIVGQIYGNKNIVVAISKSINNCIFGLVFVGAGLIGGISGNIDIAVNVSDIISHCLFYSVPYASGLIDHVYNNTNMVVTLSNSQVSGVASEYLPDATGFVSSVSSCANASVTISNCTNELSGDDNYQSGFIGYISDNNDTSLHFSNCVNNANITQSFGHAGGFVMMLSRNTNLNITLSRAINNGIVKNKYNGGGFIGFSEKNSKTNIVFFNCTNHGQLLGNTESYKLGGFVGGISDSNETNMIILNCENNGPVTVRYDKVGGFIGYIANNNNSTVFISKSLNHGEITGTNKLMVLLG